MGLSACPVGEHIEWDPKTQLLKCQFDGECFPKTNFSPLTLALIKQ